MHDLTHGLQRRAYLFRADAPASDDGPHVSGIAVPYGEEILLWEGIREQVAPGAVEDYDPQLWWRHYEPIGVITGAGDAPKGWRIKAMISDTTQGRDARTLVRDGAVTSFSIGFEPIEWREEKLDDGTLLITHERIRVREVSIVPNPAYPGAVITEARHQEGNPMHATTTPNNTPAVSIEDFNGLREDLADVRRLITATDRPTAPDTRSAGQLIRAALNGENTAVGTLERAYTGTTIADDFAKPTWVKDLTRIIEAADPLAGLFAEGALPETGMTLEFGQLKENTVTVGKQAKEGDKLPVGKVSVKTATAEVETFGGAAEMSVQVMKRAQAPMIDIHMQALAVAAGKQRATSRVAAINAAVAAQSSAAVTVTDGGTDWKPWVKAFADIDETFTALGYTVSGLLLPKAEFIKLMQLADKDGKPMLQLGGVGSNVGTGQTPAFRAGSLLGMPIYSGTGVTQGAFFHKDAIRHYKAPMVRVTNDLSALDLTSAFGVYEFGAIATEVPGAIVPVTIS